MNRNVIRDIVFDLGKVLCPFDWAIAHRRLLPHLPFHRAQLLRENPYAFKDLFRESAVALEMGRIDFVSFQHAMEQILGIELDREEFHHIWCDIFSVDDKMVNLGRALSIHYRTWLASNTNKVHYEWILARFPRVAFYRDAFLSYDIGIMKPEPAYYRKLIGKFAIEPARSVFIDDLKENVDAAVVAGMHGIQYHDFTRLQEQLGALGVELPAKQVSEGEWNNHSA
jgi:FMN phosphatase YigB (HAD superfamily)